MGINLARLYQGITLPLSGKTQGLFTPSGTFEVIRSSIRLILLTRIGEVVMNPEFGSRIWELIGEPNDQLLASLAYQYTVQAVKRWENRVSITDVKTLVDDHSFTIQVWYIHKELKQPDNLLLVLQREA